MKIIDGKDLVGLKFIQQEDGTLKIYNGKSKFIPKENEIYYYIDGGAIYTTGYDPHYDQDQWRIKHQRLFRTEADAADYLLFLEQLDKYTCEFTPDSGCYAICYSHSTNEIKAIGFNNIQHSSHYFSSEKVALSFISEARKDRIKKYLFDIWED